MKNGKVFISRALTPESEFLKILQPIGFEIIGESLVTFKNIPFSTLPDCDWVFFYSKQAVHSFFENIQHSNLTLEAKLAVFGNGTAQALEKKSYRADFTGVGRPAETAIYFGMLAKGCKVLFPRALNSRISVQQLLQDKIEAIDLIVYENSIRTDFEVPACEWLVFTSPLNAAAYFQKQELKNGQKIVAIGQTTATALKQLNINTVHIAEAPSELALAQVIRAAIQP